MKYPRLVLLFPASLAALALAGCAAETNSHNTTVIAAPMMVRPQSQPMRPAMVADPRSDEQIAKLLPADAYTQTEFPKTFVTHMMRICLEKNLNDKKSLPTQAGKIDEWCACLQEKRVHRFTLSNFMQGDRAGFDPKTVPEAAHLDGDIRAECLKSVLN